jgi:hypothetical protein
LHVSDSYAHLIDKAKWSHAHGRNVSHIVQADIDAARLFSYGYRSQAIGAFHATRAAIEMERSSGIEPYVGEHLHEAHLLLKQLEAKAIDPILHDHRALISTLHSYDLWTNSVEELLRKSESHARLVSIRQRFLDKIQRVTGGNGIYIANDFELPKQGVFVVPDLNISIAPIIYGDYHSWNAAFLVAGQPGVSVHRHREGAEIHLGYSPVKGRTVLGSSFSEVEEGYVMPIPPMTDHGFLNASEHGHVVPFVFGSLKRGGWGIYFDVEPRPGEEAKRERQPLESQAMNQSVFLERAIQQSKGGIGYLREVLVPARRAGSPETGGLELALTRMYRDAIKLDSLHYRIVSVRSGKGRIRMGNVEAGVSEHDHFGIPPGMDCIFTPGTADPLIFLDAMILPIPPEEGVVSYAR